MSYFPNKLQTASVPWMSGQQVSPIHFYEMEGHLRSLALLPLMAMAPSHGLLKIPPYPSAAHFELHTLETSAARQTLLITVHYCTGMTLDRQWIFSSGLKQELAVTREQGPFPDVYLSLTLSGEKLVLYGEQEFPEGYFRESQDMDEELEREVRVPVYTLESQVHNPQFEGHPPNVHPGSLAFGRLIYDQGEYRIDPNFLPPSMHLRDLPSWSRRATELQSLARSTVESIGAHFGSIDYQPTHERTHFLSLFALHLEPLADSSRWLGKSCVDFVNQYANVFRQLTLLLALFRSFLKSLRTNASIEPWLASIQQARSELEHYPPENPPIDASSCLKAVELAMPAIQSLASSVRGALVKDNRNPPDRSFYFKDMPLEYWTNKYFKRDPYNKVLLRFSLEELSPRGDRTRGIHLLDGLAILFSFTPVEDCKPYNSSPRIEWLIYDGATPREDAIVLSEAELEQLAHSRGYVGIFLDIRRIDVRQDIRELTVVLPFETLPREAMCYAHYREPEPLREEPPKPEPSWGDKQPISHEEDWDDKGDW